MPKVGLVVLNYRDYENTKKFVDSISDYSAIDEIVIVDNDSKDESATNLANMACGKISFLRALANGGYSSGNNLGLRFLIQKGCDILIVSNPDVIVAEQIINNMVSCLETYDVSFVSGIACNTNGKVQPKAYWDVPTYLYLLRSLFFIGRAVNRRHRNRFEPYSGDSFLVDAIPGCLFAAKAKDFLSLGLFDENTFLYCEEDILAIKCKMNSLNVAVLPNSRYIHAHASTTSKVFKVYQSQAQLHKSQKYYMREYLRVGPVRMVVFSLASFASNVEFYVLYAAKEVKKLMRR